MRSALLVPLALLVAGCLGGTEEPLAGQSNETDGDGPAAGICVVGVDSPCNGPQWRDPALGPRPIEGEVDCYMTSLAVEVDGPRPFEVGTFYGIDLVATWIANGTRATVPDACPVLWDFGDGTNANTGGSVSHMWDAPGSYLVLATFSTGYAELRVGLPDRQTWNGTVLLGTGGVCLQAGVTCEERYVTIGEMATSFAVSVATPVVERCAVTLFDPEGNQAGNGGSVTVEAPAAGDWLVGVTCLGPNASYAGSYEVLYAGDA